jgi:hypothetical protein
LLEGASHCPEAVQTHVQAINWALSRSSPGSIGPAALLAVGILFGAVCVLWPRVGQ